MLLDVSSPETDHVAGEIVQIPADVHAAISGITEAFPSVPLEMPIVCCFTAVSIANIERSNEVFFPAGNQFVSLWNRSFWGLTHSGREIKPACTGFPLCEY